MIALTKDKARRETTSRDKLRVRVWEQFRMMRAMNRREFITL
jgi:hypothetical protein